MCEGLPAGRFPIHSRYLCAMDYRDFWRALSPALGPGEAKAVARLVYGERFGLSYGDLLVGKVSNLTEEGREWLAVAVRRLSAGEPVQYVLGYAEFCGRRFAVGPGVLVPRPETEELCRMVAASIAGKRAARVLDACCGSGCIGVTLALETPGAEVCVWDLYEAPLQTTMRNAGALGACVNVERVDVLAAVPCGEEWDAIVSNPPYVMESEKGGMGANVLDYEPHEALFVEDTDPMLFYRAISRYAAVALRPGGGLFFEVNPLCAGGVVRMMEECGLEGASVWQDCFGRERFATAVKPTA